MKWIVMGLLATVLAAVLFVLAPALSNMTALAVEGAKTVEDRLAEYGPAVEDRLRPKFQEAGCAYPPARLALLAFKEEKTLEVYTPDRQGNWRRVAVYPILATSGHLGPKLREGDYQVPEGVYPVTFLNANSRFHLSLRLGYPNTYDRAKARAEGRENLGGDIMIHGNAVSIGCLAMGDPAAEDLFILAARAGIAQTEVVIAPVDFRKRGLPEALPPMPEWTGELYRALRAKLEEFPVQP
jgi:hypothetical protein